MNENFKALLIYRLEQATESLESAELLYEHQKYRSANNDQRTTNNDQRITSNAKLPQHPSLAKTLGPCKLLSLAPRPYTKDLQNNKDLPER